MNDVLDEEAHVLNTVGQPSSCRHVASLREESLVHFVKMIRKRLQLQGWSPWPHKAHCFMHGSCSRPASDAQNLLHEHTMLLQKPSKDKRASPASTAERFPLKVFTRPFPVAALDLRLMLLSIYKKPTSNT